MTKIPPIAQYYFKYTLTSKRNLRNCNQDVILLPVELPLSSLMCIMFQNTKTQTVVKLTVVPCAPVVEVKIKRPDTKYQLGFSVQNGVICSLLRGGIAERGGVRVGHRIIEINNQSVVAVPHEKIVNLLATSVGEVSITSTYYYLLGMLDISRTVIFSLISKSHKYQSLLGIPVTVISRLSIDTVKYHDIGRI